MEEYEPHVVRGNVIYAGVDYEAILREAEKEADVVIWDGGNNDFSFYVPDLMITVVDRGTLEDAQKHPEKYPDLLVRVAGYSARFIDLTKDIQDELLTRELYD